MPILDPSNAPESAWLGSVLTWTAGFVDAVGYLTLFHIYAANMSGNSVSLAIESARASWWVALAHALPVAAFFPGLIAGAVIVQVCKNARWRAVLMPALLIEAALLILFLVVVHHRAIAASMHAADYGQSYIAAVALLAFAMGMQNGALRRIGGLRNVHTYVTGTLLATAEGLTNFLFWFHARARRGVPGRFSRVMRYARRQKSLRTAGFAGWLWVLYVIGAIAGTIGLAHWRERAMLGPIALLLLIAAVDLLWPVAHPRERACSAISSRSRSES